MNIEIPKNKIQLFFLGFYILAIGSSLMSVPNIPIVINRIIQLLGILFISILFSVEAYYGNMGLYARSIFLLFVTYQLVIIFRDNQLSLWGIQRHIFTPGYLLYVAPILIYKLSDLLFINQIIRLVTLLCKTFVFGIILFLPYALSRSGTGINLYETFHGILGVGAIWGILMQEYLTKVQKRWIFIAVSITILLALIQGRRSILLMYVIAMLFHVLYKFSYELQSVKKRILYFFSLSSLLIIIYLFMSFYGSILFDTLFERMLEDTRSIVELNFLDDIRPGSFDFIWGRGISGTYYCPFVEFNGDDYREHIESGYLELILKGGFVLVILYFFFTLPAIFLGLFRSKNNLCKLSSIYCVLFSGFLYGVGSYYTFGIRYILFLFSVFICYKKNLRSLTNNDIVEMFNNK